MLDEYKYFTPEKRNTLDAEKLTSLNNNEKIYNNFNYQIYDSLSQYGEKMRYICTYNLLTEYDIEKLNYTIENDIDNGLDEDPKNALKAIIILLKLDAHVPTNEIISKKILNLFQFDDLINDCTYLVFNLLLKNPQNFELIKKLVIEQTTEQLYSVHSKIVKLWIKLSNFYDFELPLDFFDSIFSRFDRLNFEQKKCFIDLSCTMLLNNQDSIAIFLKHRQFLEICLVENFEICPDKIIFIITKLESSIDFSAEFNTNIIEKINLMIENI